MGNPSSTNLPTGDLSALGLSPRQVEIPAEEPVVEEVQETAPQEEAVVPSEPEPVEEMAVEEVSVLDQYSELVADEPVQASVDPALSEAQKQIEQLQGQLSELIGKRDEEVAQKASEAEGTDQDVDLTSPVIQQYLAELRRNGQDDEASRVESRLIEEKVKAETKKQTAGIEEKFQAAEFERRTREAMTQAEKRVGEAFRKAAALGGVEAELVNQFKNTPEEKRHLTELGKQFISDPNMVMSAQSVYQMIRARAADISDTVKTGKSPAPPVNESTGVSSVSRQKSVAVNTQDETLTPQQIEHMENEALADHLVDMNKMPEGLGFLKPL